MVFRPGKWWVPVFFSLFIGACASVPLHYDHPALIESPSTNLRIAVNYTIDQRAEGKAMDRMFQKDPIDELSHIIAEEIQSTGLFKEVILVPRERLPGNAPGAFREVDLVVNSCLKRMAWNAPNYQRKKAESSLLMAYGGAFAMVAYDMAEADMYGDFKMNIKVTRPSTGDCFLEKDYVGHVKGRMDKLSYDAPETKSVMVGKAIKSVMDRFRIDLENAVRAGAL